MAVAMQRTVKYRSVNHPDRTVCDSICLRRGLEQDVWYGKLYQTTVKFRGIQGWRSSKITLWVGHYLDATKYRATVEASTLKECVRLVARRIELGEIQ